MSSKGVWAAKAWDIGEGQDIEHCKLASLDYFEPGETVHIVMVTAKIPLPEPKPEPINDETCDVALLG